jgi:hypothetical protein
MYCRRLRRTVLTPLVSTRHITDPAVRAGVETFLARDAALVDKQAKAFEAGIPNATVVRLPHANHYVFISNESDVLREMDTFIGKLPDRDSPLDYIGSNAVPKLTLHAE